MPAGEGDGVVATHFAVGEGGTGSNILGLSGFGDGRCLNAAEREWVVVECVGV